MPLFLPLAVAALGVQATATTVLAPDAEARWVPFELTPTNQIRFEAQVGGQRARAILDTGLSNTIVTGSFARSAGLRATGHQQALAIGGGVEIAWARGPALAFGGLTHQGGRIGITDLPGQERFGADLLVGSDVLGCCAVEIDYDLLRFRILPSGRLPFTGATARLQSAPASGVPVTDLGLGGKRLRPVIVDTGDGAWVTLSRAAWNAADDRGAQLSTTLGWGMGGAVVNEVAVLTTMRLAGVPLGDTEIRIESEGGYSIAAGVAGRIGTGLLSRYHVLLDPRAGRMVLRPGARAHEPVQRSTSGLLLAALRDRLRVLHVMRGSPAADGGWHNGDEICYADGAPVADRPVDWAAGAPGRTVQLVLCDGRARSLTLRQFY